MERLERMLVMGNNNNASSSRSNGNVNVNKYVPYLQEVMNRANNSNKILNPSKPQINIAHITSSATPQQQQFQCT